MCVKENETADNTTVTLNVALTETQTSQKIILASLLAREC
jgi:hypothetical protein